MSIFENKDFSSSFVSFGASAIAVCKIASPFRKQLWNFVYTLSPKQWIQKDAVWIAKSAYGHYVVEET